jgi:hypothetical protein
MNASFRFFQGSLNKERETPEFLVQTDLVIIPGGLSSQLQVLDVNHSVTHLYEEWLASGNCLLTPAGNI